MTYSKQYSISTLSGVYAQKYSVTVDHAERLDALLRLIKSSAVSGWFCCQGGPRQFDGYDALNALMKVLKYVMKDPRRTFLYEDHCCDAEEEEKSGASFADSDDAGEFEVRAYDKTGLVIRGAESSAF